MPKYVIERDIPGVGDSPSEALQAVSQSGGFPANRISEIKAIIDPTTAEA